MKPNPLFSLLAGALSLAAVESRAGADGKETGKPERPAAAEKEPKDKTKDDLVDSLKKGFQEKSDTIQTKQKELLAALKTAKGEEREKLRDALKALQEEFKEQKEKFKDQVQEAKDKLGDLKTKLEEEAKQEREKKKPRDR